MADKNAPLWPGGPTKAQVLEMKRCRCPECVEFESADIFVDATAPTPKYGMYDYKAEDCVQKLVNGWVYW